MKHRFALSLVFVLALILVGSATVQAQPNATRVGVVVLVDTPERFPLRAEQVAADALREFRASLNNLRGVNLVEQDALNSAQQHLDVRLNIGSGTRDMQAVSNLLELDRLVIIDINVSGGFGISVTAKAFNNENNRTLVVGARAESDNFGLALSRVMADLVQALVPFLP